MRSEGGWQEGFPDGAAWRGTGRDEILRKKFGRKFQFGRGKGFGTKGRYRD